MRGDRQPRDWELVMQVEDGHKYFLDRGSGRIGVADQSGYFPHQTEDGVLWLDKTRSVRVEDGDHIHIFVPLLCFDGTRSSTPVGVEEAVEVVRMFGLSLRVGSAVFILQQNAKQAPEDATCPRAG